jgi:hypothetical protein
MIDELIEIIEKDFPLFLKILTKTYIIKLAKKENKINILFDKILRKNLNKII